MPLPVRYRRSPHVVCYWKAGEFLFHNYATGRRCGASALACDILDFFVDWCPLADLRAAKPDMDASSLRLLVQTLVDVTLLQRSDFPPDVRETAMDRLDRWNPEAGLFHTASRDVRFIDADTSARALKAQSQSWPMPSPVKRYPNAALTPLPASAQQGAIEEALLARRTWRRFGPGTIPLATFGALLGLTAGVQEWVAIPGHGEAPLKTSPSGGARHPVEVYTLAWGIEGLQPGLYHYAADEHALERLPVSAGPERVADYFPQAGYFREACAILLFAAFYERDLWRYPYSRAYRAPLVEAGHLCQTFCLLATARGLAPFCLMGLADSVIDRDLGLDGITESVLYAAGVGVLPEGGGWAPAPPGFEVPLVRTNSKLRA